MSEGWVESAGDPGSDYELWSPYDGRQSGGKCLLGHQVPPISILFINMY